MKNLLIVLMLFMLSACANNLEDLNRFIANEKAKPAKPIDPLPEIKPMEVFEYNAQSSRDPFSNDLEESEDEPTEEQMVAFENGQGPDLTRRKEFLESFPLDSLMMVGTYQQEDDFWGLVIDPDGNIWRVAVGHFVGHNYGEIVSIAENEIVISEWINDGLGAWREREAAMALKEE
ncbi:pilus assembly protein PilP [Marinicella rhabdoformis]|uniref:pilus assembly protein PilP n=1 Tax=Marinicella rhabdoformis TaxID=2580566 RepID=UPI0012AECD24|nr:pilus assembly protein PilP [Marinicella rhabdoformis]